jgi:hypothetical protein
MPNTSKLLFKSHTAIGFYVKIMSAHGSHLGWRSWSPYTIGDSRSYFVIGIVRFKRNNVELPPLLQNDVFQKKYFKWCVTVLFALFCYFLYQKEKGNRSWYRISDQISFIWTAELINFIQQFSFLFFSIKKNDNVRLAVWKTMVGLKFKSRFVV